MGGCKKWLEQHLWGEMGLSAGNLAQLQNSPQLLPKFLHSWLGSTVLELWGVTVSVPSEAWLPKETNVYWVIYIFSSYIWVIKMTLEEGSGWIHCWGCSASICSYLSSEGGLEEGEGAVLCGQPSFKVNGVKGCLLEVGNYPSAVHSWQSWTEMSQTLGTDSPARLCQSSREKTSTRCWAKESPKQETFFELPPQTWRS